MSNTLAARFLRTSESLMLRRSGETYNSGDLEWAKRYLTELSKVTDYFFEGSIREIPSSRKVWVWDYFKNSFSEGDVMGEIELVDGMLYGLERVMASGNKQTEVLESYFLRLGEVMLGRALANERSDPLSFGFSV